MSTRRGAVPGRLAVGRKPKGPEASFLSAVVAFARLRGWRVAHFRPARTADGWRTPVEFDGKGFVDLVLVKHKVVWAELKSHTGRLSPDQQKWIESLRTAGEKVYVWRPDSWGEIESVLA